MTPANQKTNLSLARQLPSGVIALGFVSLFTDISSELIHSLLPIYLVSILGASMTSVGFIEGVAEATASIIKVFSGTLSDHFRKRKSIAVIGYSLSAFSKFLFPLVSTVGLVFTARFVDRIGKGIRGAPRDALIADIVPAEQRGAAYGLRQSLDSIGAFVGPVLAIALMILFENQFKQVLWFAVIPAVISVLILLLAVKEPEINRDKDVVTSTIDFTLFKHLSKQYWFLVFFGALFTFSRFSEAFLILRAQETGMQLAYVPLVMVVMNIVYAAFAYPVGKLADRFPNRLLLIVGLLILILADLILSVTGKQWLMFIGVSFWGLHMAFTQGLLSKLVADSAPEFLRGTAFGIFNLMVGLALLFASVIAGFLWTHFGYSITFLSGAAFAFLSLLGFLFFPVIESSFNPD